MSLSCLLVDDERPALNLLMSFIDRTPGLTLSGSYTDPEKALEAAKASPPDVAFLDIDMPGINGFDLANDLNANTMIVYTTSFREFAADAYEQAAIDYLLKPILYDRFLNCVSRLVKKQNETPEYIYLKDAGKGTTVRILLKDILYVAAALNYLEIHRADNHVLIYSGIGDFEKRLPEHFIRIHRSYIVNCSQIEKTTNQSVILKDGTILPVSRKYTGKLKSALLS